MCCFAAIVKRPLKEQKKTTAIKVQATRSGIFSFYADTWFKNVNSFIELDVLNKSCLKQATKSKWNWFL